MKNTWPGGSPEGLGEQQGEDRVQQALGGVLKGRAGAGAAVSCSQPVPPGHIPKAQHPIQGVRELLAPRQNRGARLCCPARRRDLLSQASGAGVSIC